MNEVATANEVANANEVAIANEVATQIMDFVIGIVWCVISTEVRMHEVEKSPKRGT